MADDALVYFIHAFSPIHVGVEQGLGAVDLPTMRAIHTGDPLVPGSSVKGVLRDLGEAELAQDPIEFESAFGPTQERAGDFQGGLVFGDALILALPVRSLSGGFAWITCPRVLARFKRDAADAGVALVVPKLSPRASGSIGTTTSVLAIGDATRQVFLDELLLDFEAAPSVATLTGALGTLIWPRDEATRDTFASRFLVVHDDVFGFYCRVGLEVRARVKINDETGTAARSGPWTEEHIPTEAILAGIAFGRATLWKDKDHRASDKGTERKKADGIKSLRKLLRGGRTLRFGGHATIGLGRAWIGVAGGGE